MRRRHRSGRGAKKVRVRELLEVTDCGAVLLGDLVPVDDLEEGVDEVAAGRTVVVVVRVLPDVEGQNRVGTPERALIVLVDRDVAKLLRNRVVDQQRPAAGSGRGGLELALPAFVGAKVLLDAV